jgi:hypothetical protein
MAICPEKPKDTSTFVCTCVTDVLFYFHMLAGSVASLLAGVVFGGC